MCNAAGVIMNLFMSWTFSVLSCAQPLRLFVPFYVELMVS